MLNCCSVYINSFPLGGGTAFPEALMSGCSVAGLRGVGWGYSYADQLLSADTDAFLQDCLELSSGDLAALQRQQDVRQRCVDYHQPAAVRARLDSSLSEKRLLGPPEDQLRDLPKPILETMWQAAGSSQTPLTLRVSFADRKWLASQHRKVFGLSSGSRQLMFWASAPVYKLQPLLVFDNGL